MQARVTHGNKKRKKKDKFTNQMTMLRLIFLITCLLKYAKGVLISQIISPKDGEVVFQQLMNIRGYLSYDIELDDMSLLYCCWSIKSIFLDETSSSCTPFGDMWNEENIIEVPLPNRGRYEVTLSVLKVEILETGVQNEELLSEARSSFTFEITPKCQQELRDRQFVQPRYYDHVINSGPSNGIRNEKSLDLEEDQWVNFERAPLCFKDWIYDDKENRNSILRHMVSVTSASRGMFGVDFSMQQFGHGDTMMLDFVLDRHRSAPPNYIEMGTFGGVTALYLGMASRLRGGKVNTFDISDDRSDQVKSAWLPNMAFHLGDANAVLTGDASIRSTEVIDAIKEAGIVLVDHADRLNFTVKAVAPNLRRDAVILVHDFPPEFTTEAMWHERLAPFGIVRQYSQLQGAFDSCLAVFTFQQ